MAQTVPSRPAPLLLLGVMVLGVLAVDRPAASPAAAATPAATVAISAPTAPPPARTHKPRGDSPYTTLFQAAGAAHGVDAAVLEAVARVESHFHPGAVSSAGALGLMQLMPATARYLVVDPLDPGQAIDGAARLLAGYLAEFGRLDEALAAYNAGGPAVRRYHGVPPFPETQHYVHRIEELLAWP